MAVYLKCWLLERQLFMLRKNVIVSLCGRAISCQSRNILSSAKIFSSHDSQDVTALGKDKEIPFLKKENNSSQIDQNFIDEIYKKGTEADLRNVSNSAFNKTEYFKQAWHSKLKAMAQNELSKSSSEDMLVEKAADDQCESERHFGTLHEQQDVKPGASKVADSRDPNERMVEEYPDDKDDERDPRRNIPLARYGRLGRKAFYYTKKMTKLGREGKINEAMQVFDEWMMVQDRVMPSKRTFITLIGIVGRAGYTRKAFQLFRQMKQLGLDPPDQVYTSLFNACANCPMSDYGLKHANSLYQQMQVKGIPPSPITTMASMKAFALCGDFPKAFQILDEARIPLDVQCFNTLLMACAMDEQSGFRRALKVWQAMREYNIKPAYQTYNLLVRCVRDCGVGDVNSLAADLGLGQRQREIPPVDFFKTWEGDNALLTSGDQSHTDNTGESGSSLEDGPRSSDKTLTQAFNKYADKQELTQLSASDDKSMKSELSSRFRISDTSHETEWWENNSKELKWGGNEKTDSTSLGSDVMTKSVEVRQVNPSTDMTSDLSLSKSVTVSDLNTKPGRLALVGGVTTLISHMMGSGIKPDIRTFTELLSCVPNNAESEQMVLRIMEGMNVPPDVDFLNNVMMRRNMRHESHSIREVLVLVSKLRLTPNMQTYAAMALTCHSWKEAQVLLEDMEAANVEPSVEVMGHLVYISRLNFLYKRRLLEKMEDMALKPSRRVIGMVEKSIAIAKRHVVTAEKNADGSSVYLSPNFERQFRGFLQFYKSWLLRMELDKEIHPWERFTDGDKRKDKVVLSVEKSNMQ